MLETKPWFGAIKSCLYNYMTIYIYINTHIYTYILYKIQRTWCKFMKLCAFP